MAAWLIYLILVGHSLEFPPSIELTSLANTGEPASHANIFGHLSNQVTEPRAPPASPASEVHLSIDEDEEKGSRTAEQSSSQASTDHASSSGQAHRSSIECPICWEQRSEIDGLKRLPECQHEFCTPCIDKWLEEHNNCPVCREVCQASSVPTNTRVSALIRAGFDGLDADFDEQVGVFWVHTPTFNEAVISINEFNTQARQAAARQALVHAQEIERLNLQARIVAQRDRTRKRMAQIGGTICSLAAIYFMVEYFRYMTRLYHI